jgi:1-acyl-sn-glycerol-3-phosphate acyltransferase
VGDGAKIDLDGLRTLTQINLDDLVSSFGWQDKYLPARILRGFFHQTAQTFAKFMVDFDTELGKRGLVGASQTALGHYVDDVRVFGLDRVPDSAFLALSNHPGMTDTLALFAALKRSALKVIALDRPFLMALPNMSRQLFFVNDEPALRMKLVRQVSAHLRNGGTVLTFPAGEIEPDPNIYPGATESLKTWTDSVGVLVRLAPETVILPVLVRNVIWDKTANHRLLKIKKTRKEREKLAAALQLLAMVVWHIKPVIVTVQIGNVVDPKILGTTDTQILHQAVLKEMKFLIENPPQGDGVSVL